MLSCWQFLVVLFFLSHLSRGNIYEIEFESVQGGSGTFPAKIDFKNEANKEDISYGDITFKKATIVEVDLKAVNNLDGVKGKFVNINGDSRDKFVTLINQDGNNFYSDKIENIKIECTVENCKTGLFIISGQNIQSFTDINVNETKAFFLLFTHGKTFYSFSKIDLDEYKNPLVRCPIKEKWFPKNKYLKYELHEAFKDIEDKINSGTYYRYPAVKTNTENNTMECGSLYFKSKKILTVGYDLNIKQHNIQSFEYDSLEGLDCKKIDILGPVEALITKVSYIPLDKTFNNVPKLQEEKNSKTDIESLKDSAVYLLYGGSGNLDCSYRIIPKSNQTQYNVLLNKAELKKKKLAINSKVNEYKIFEIDISRDSNKNDFRGLTENVCNISRTGDIGDEKTVELSREYYSLQYKSVFYKLDFKDSKALTPEDPKILESIGDSGIKNPFEIFGLYECNSIDKSYKLARPKDINITNFERFLILPKEGKGIVETFLESYKKDFHRKGKCDVKKQNFGFLESISLNKDGKDIKVEMSKINENKDFEHSNDTKEIIYKGDIEKQTKLICTYKTDYDLKFTITKIFDFKTNTTLRNVTKTSPDKSSKDNSSNSTVYFIPIMISVVVGVGIIAISIVFAVIFLRKRRKRRGKKKKGLKKRMNPSPDLDIKTTSDSSSLNSSKDKKVLQSKNVKKASTVDISSSESKSLQNSNIKVASDAKQREIIRFTTK
uniref:6-cysteine protein n=1 Tax=Strongyloides papillosus TaxID=174720 RepID=A0A0N5BNB5_STREA